MNKVTSAVANAVKSRRFWGELFVMTFGMFLAAAAVHYFMQPSKIIVGSISGLSIVIYRLTGIPVSVLTFIINLVLLVLAYFLIGKEFGAKTVYTALILSPWLRFFEIMDKKLGIDANTIFGFADGQIDYWFYLLCFILILSIVQALLFRINASTGGLDILAKIVNKYLHIDIGTSVTVAGAIICCTAFFVPGNSIYLVVMGFIGTWIDGLAVDYFTAGFNAKRRVCIISKDYQIIQDYIVNELVRGVTLYDIRGGYTNERKVELETLLTNEEYAKVMDFINKNNLDTFMTAGKVSEVYGLWRKKGNKIEKSKMS